MDSIVIPHIVHQVLHGNVRDANGKEHGRVKALWLIRKNYEVISRETSVPADLFIEAVSFFMVHCSYFTFNAEIYRQSKGLPMGNRLSQVLADMSTNYAATQAIQAIDQERVSFLFKYVDDFLGAMDPEVVDEFEKKIVSFIRGLPIKRTDESPEGGVSFLDTYVTRDTASFENEAVIRMQWWQKECSSRQILNFHSNHPVSMKRNVVDEFIRHALSVTSPILYQETIKRLTVTLRKSSYPLNFVKRSLNATLEKIGQVSTCSTVGEPDESFSFLDEIALRCSNGKKQPSAVTVPARSDVKGDGLNAFKSEDVERLTPYIKFPFLNEEFLKSASKIIRANNVRCKLAPGVLRSNRFTIFSMLKEKVPLTCIKFATFGLSCNGCGFVWYFRTHNLDVCRTIRFIVNRERSELSVHQSICVSPEVSFDLVQLKKYRNQFELSMAFVELNALNQESLRMQNGCNGKNGCDGKSFSTIAPNATYTTSSTSNTTSSSSGRASSGHASSGRSPLVNVVELADHEDDRNIHKDLLPLMGKLYTSMKNQAVVQGRLNLLTLCFQRKVDIGNDWYNVFNADKLIDKSLRNEPLPVLSTDLNLLEKRRENLRKILHQKDEEVAGYKKVIYGMVTKRSYEYILGSLSHMEKHFKSVVNETNDRMYQNAIASQKYNKMLDFNWRSFLTEMNNDGKIVYVDQFDLTEGEVNDVFRGVTGINNEKRKGVHDDEKNESIKRIKGDSQGSAPVSISSRSIPISVPSVSSNSSQLPVPPMSQSMSSKSIPLSVQSKPTPTPLSIPIERSPKKKSIPSSLSVPPERSILVPLPVSSKSIELSKSFTKARVLESIPPLLEWLPNESPSTVQSQPIKRQIKPLMDVEPVANPSFLQFKTIRPLMSIVVDPLIAREEDYVE